VFGLVQVPGAQRLQISGVSHTENPLWERKAQEYNNDHSRHSGSSYFPDVLIERYH